jgi:hypothetical protein
VIAEKKLRRLNAELQQTVHEGAFVAVEEPTRTLAPPQISFTPRAAVA